jgi:hypothetical protein
MHEVPGDSPEALASYFLSGEGLTGVEAQPHDHGAADGVSSSVREFEYRNHLARIETTYRVTIDGEPLRGRLEVLPSGAVHYHRFPQYAPASAVDVVKAVIDTVWDKPQVPDELATIDHEHPAPPEGTHQHPAPPEGTHDHPGGHS